MRIMLVFRKIIMAVIIVLFLPSVGKGAQPKNHSLLPTFYVGMSASLDHLSGKRTEGIVSGVAPGSEALYFSNNQSLSGNGLAAKGIVGFLWTIPKTSFVLSPEVYLGQGSTEKTIQASVHDLNGAANKGLQSTLRRSLMMGFIFRMGFHLTNCQNNLAYVLVGAEQSKFENQYTLTSNDVLGAAVPALFEKRTKWLRSPVIGVGFEKKFNNFKVGVDLRYAPYSSWGGYSRKADVSEDVISVVFKPKVISTSLTLCYLF